METREETFRNMALKYKEDYDNTPADEGQICIFRNNFFTKRYL